MDAGAGMARETVRKSDANGTRSGGSANGSGSSSGGSEGEVVAGEKAGMVEREEMPSGGGGGGARQQVAVVTGPRPAPSYRVVSAVIEKKEDGPGPRCGHTLTAVAAVGDEGAPGYVGPRLILFGGATALEGNSSAASGPQTATPGAGIRKGSSML